MGLTDTGSRIARAAKGNPAQTVCWIATAIIGVLIWQLKVLANENVRLQARYEAVMEKLVFARHSPEVDLVDTVDALAEGKL